MTTKTGASREQSLMVIADRPAGAGCGPAKRHTVRGRYPHVPALADCPRALAGCVIVLLRVALVRPAAFCLLTASAATAQNVSITDYVVPVSRAHNLRVDALSFNYVTEGDETVVQNGNVTVVYKKFYESLPYAYSVDATGQGSIRKNIITKENERDAVTHLKTNLKKYHRNKGNFFYSWGTESDMDSGYDRPDVEMTLGFGHGRFIDATALRKAGRIEEFFLEEGIIGEHFSRETMIELAHIIDREREYKEQHGDRYENYWFEDMLAEIRRSRRVLGDEIGFGLVRMQEVLTQEQISKRFYGWDITTGVQFQVLNPYKDLDRPPPGLLINFRYSHPISWSTQINTDFHYDTPFSRSFGSAYNLRWDTDFIYEVTNRIRFTTLKTIRAQKREDREATIISHVTFALSFYIENKINMTLSESFRVARGEKSRQSFNMGLSYRIF